MDNRFQAPARLSPVRVNELLVDSGEVGIDAGCEHPTASDATIARTGKERSIIRVAGRAIFRPIEFWRKNACQGSVRCQWMTLGVAAPNQAKCVGSDRVRPRESVRLVWSARI